jgi:transposase
MWQLELSAKERRRLEARLKTAPTNRVYRKVLAILSVHDGTPVLTVAQVLRVHRLSVYNWLRAYAAARDTAVLDDHYHGSRAESWSEEIVAALRTTLEQPPDAWGYNAVNWTSPLLRKHLETAFELDVSERTIRRLMPDLGYVWKRPRHTLQDNKSPRVRRRLRQIRKRIEALPSDCVKLFADETDLLLFPPLRAGWFLRGKPADVPLSGENAKRTVFGAVNVETGELNLVAREGACAVDFQAHLRLVRQYYGERRVVMMLDRASRHTAADSEDVAAERSVELVWLPSRCTNVNPLDRLWRQGKDNTCANKQYASIDEQAHRFIQYLQGLSRPEVLRKAGLSSKKFWLFRRSQAGASRR